MKITDVWYSAFVRLGATPMDAKAMIALISGMASSPAAFAEWDSRIPDGAGAVLLKEIGSANGETFSRQLLGDVKKMVIERFGISEEEISKVIDSIGRN